MASLALAAIAGLVWAPGTPAQADRTAGVSPQTPPAQGDAGKTVPAPDAGKGPAKDAAKDAAAPAAADGASIPEEAKQPETYLEFAVAGGWLMVPIGILSILWLAFLLERLIATRRRRVLPAALVQAVRKMLGGKLERSQVAAALAAHPSSTATILGAALERLGRPYTEIEQAVDHAAQREVHGLRRNIRLFSIIASVAPLIGLLGTVTGMIQAFREVAIQGLGSGQALAPGIYKALITTAGGLTVAIPALLTYYWMMARVDNYVHEINNLVVDFVSGEKSGPPGAG